MISKENQQLINKSLAQDKLAKGELYRKYVKSMYHTAVRMVRLESVAKDLTQDAFVKVFEELGRFRGESTLGAWIKRITINTCLAYLRRRGMLQLEELNDSLLQIPESGNDVIEKVDIGVIHQAIKELPVGCRTVLTLYLLEGFQHSEISEILDVSVSTSKSQYRRGKHLLKEKLKTVYYNND